MALALIENADIVWLSIKGPLMPEKPRKPGKTLSKANLVALGADALAELLLKAVKGDSVRSNMVRMELAAHRGPEEVAADVRKRFAAIRQAKSSLTDKSRKALVKELIWLLETIEKQVAPEAPDTAFDLMWTLLQLAPRICKSVSSWASSYFGEEEELELGVVGKATTAAMEAIRNVAPKLSQDPVILADIMFEALQDNKLGVYSNAMSALGDALGDKGFAQLEKRAKEYATAPLEESELAAQGQMNSPDDRAAWAREDREIFATQLLEDIADARGDVDAWMASQTPEMKKTYWFASEAGQRLISAGRADEALRILEKRIANSDAAEYDRVDERLHSNEMVDVYHACLKALGRKDKLGEELWKKFEQKLDADALRGHLECLPDFEDDKALERAKELVLTYPYLPRALFFCQEWPDLPLAATLVRERTDELRDCFGEDLSTCAAALEEEFPFEAVLLRRARILEVLEKGKPKKYAIAALHFKSCAEADASIPDYGTHLNHEDFKRKLREEHGRKKGFWADVS